MRTKAAHTPGPHYAINYAGYICMQNVPHYVTDRDEIDGEYDLLNADHVGMEEAEANGALYASATDLLAHKQELITRLYDLKNAVESANAEMVILRLAQTDETLKKVI